MTLRVIFVLFFLVSTALAGPSLESGSYQQRWFVQGSSFTSIIPQLPLDNLTGSVDLTPSTVTYNGLGFTMPADTVTQSFEGFSISIEYDAISVSAPTSSTPVVTSQPTKVTSAGMPSIDFNFPSITGTWSITGPLGTVQSGPFSFTTPVQALPFAEEITVTRDGSNVITDYEWNDGINLTTIGLSLGDRTMFDGAIDGQSISLRYDGGNVQLASAPLPPAAVPEPSAFLTIGLIGLVSAGHRWLRRNRPE